MRELRLHLVVGMGLSAALAGKFVAVTRGWLPQDHWVFECVFFIGLFVYLGITQWRFFCANVQRRFVTLLSYGFRTLCAVTFLNVVVVGFLVHYGARSFRERLMEESIAYWKRTQGATPMQIEQFRQSFPFQYVLHNIQTVLMGNFAVGILSVVFFSLFFRFYARSLSR